MHTSSTVRQVTCKLQVFKVSKCLRERNNEAQRDSIFCAVLWVLQCIVFDTFDRRICSLTAREAVNVEWDSQKLPARWQIGAVLSVFPQ